MTDRTKLTDRQREIFAFIKRRIEDGLPPTCREICREFGFISSMAPESHLRALERKGFIVRDENVARGIRLSDRQQPRRGIPLLTLERLCRGQANGRKRK